MAALTVSIGGLPIALTQAGSVVSTTASAGTAAATLSAPSTAGSLLLVVMGASGLAGAPPLTPTISSLPDDWTLVAEAEEGVGSAHLECWVFPNNPGGISAVSFSCSTHTWYAQLSEWANVLSGGINSAVPTVFDHGEATSSAGTTLSPIGTASINASGYLAIAMWLQHLGAGATVTFTTPTGYSRLADNGTTSATDHLDLEYRLNVPSGPPVAATLTSTGTTSSAAGLVVVLTAVPLATDYTAFVAD